MASTQDCALGFGVETTFKTAAALTRFPEFVDESIDWNKKVVQGKGLRVGGRVARSARRVVSSADGGGDITIEATSKGLGLILAWLLGAGTSGVVSGATYQQNFTLADVLSSMTIQKTLPDGNGGLNPVTLLGCTAASVEINFAAEDICTIKGTVDAADYTTATPFAAPSYAAGGNLYHFAGATIASGVYTAATATTLASGSTVLADVRSGSIMVNHNISNRQNIGGGGRKLKPTVGLRDVTGKLEVEYIDNVFRDAMLNETPMVLLINYVAGALSTGFETLQIAVPEIKWDSELAKSNSTDLITQSMAFTGLDNLSATQPITISLRTSDLAL